MLRSLKGTLCSQVAGSLGLARWILALALVQNIICTHGRVVWSGVLMPCSSKRSHQFAVIWIEGFLFIIYNKQHLQWLYKALTPPLHKVQSKREPAHKIA
jgi:hypothetical protein